MTPERREALEHPKSVLKLTKAEIAEGWHWCNEFDWLLVGPGMSELACCHCLPKDHSVYKTIPPEDPVDFSPPF